ncbi:MAG TPA: hypothetical protein PKL84_15785, partial [Candidatus Hydrogenedentes bacterium]|nr:hypothetical protein [Candidatus Hydrogenedentota bacterium]
MFLIVVIALTLGAIGVTWWLAQSTGQQGGLAATQRFTARPGTTREKAVALTSSKRPSGVDEFTTEPVFLGKNAPPRVRSLSQEDGPEETATVERLVREALEEARPRDVLVATGTVHTSRDERRQRQARERVAGQETLAGEVTVGEEVRRHRRLGVDE